MRKLWFAAAVVAGLAMAGPASAQRVWQNGRWVVMPQRSAPTVMPTRANRWPMVNGRWSAGWQAPGGWGAYRRLNRGQRLPGYWMGAGFRIDDYLSFGLAAPPPGYFWTRYYDDAVLTDGRGDVWDSVGGIGWGGGGGYADGGSYSHSESYSNATVGAGYRQPIQPVDPNGYYGAPAYDAPIPYPGTYAPPPPPPVVYAPPAPVVQQAYQGAYQNGAFYGGNAYQGGSTSYYSSGGYGYSAGGGTTTVVITPAPTVTTTVIEEEVIEEEVVRTSYVRTAPRRVVRRAPVRKVRAKVKAKSCCVCVCR